MLTFASGVLVTSTCHRNPPSLCDTIDTRLQTDDFDSSPRLHSAFGYVRDHLLSPSGDEHEREHLDFLAVHCFCICTIARIAPTQKDSRFGSQHCAFLHPIQGAALGGWKQQTVNHHMAFTGLTVLLLSLLISAECLLLVAV